MPAAVIHARVEDYLRKSEALDRIWHRPIASAQLQAEIDRMAAKSRAPGVLRELFEALDNDPELVAECLARPHLADRLIHDWYAYDGRFHTEARANAEKGLEALERGVDVRRLDAVVMSIDEDSPAEGANGGEPPRRVVSEDREAFSIRVSQEMPGRAQQEWVASWPKRPFDDWWKERAEAIEPGEPRVAGRWTVPRTLTGSPCTDDTWSSLGSDVPSPRMKPSAVWTGTEMLVWGGSGYSGYVNTGARYDPVTDTWTYMPADYTTPAARVQPAAVWTGTEMIVWGGKSNVSNALLTSGGRYDPVTGTWMPTRDDATTPNPRWSMAAVWTGSEMIVFGGELPLQYVTYNTGGRYDPSSNTWVPLVPSALNPEARTEHTAVWTGNEMLIWGGRKRNGTRLQSGGAYEPATASWRALPIEAATPAARRGHTAVWTGTEMIIWGGGLAGGGRYDPMSDSWSPVNTGAASPPSLTYSTAVWTGREMIV